MTSYTHLPLQKAIYNALVADSQLMEIISGVYDRPPPNTPYPYISFGDVAQSDRSVMGNTCIEIQQRLHVWNREGGRKEVADIMQRIHSVLHLRSLSLEGQILVNLRYITSRSTLQNDGVTFLGQADLLAYVKIIAA